MQIEFIGCTGAGKSTLITRILQECQSQRIDAWRDYDFVLKQARLDWVQNEFARGMMVNLMSMLVALLTWRRHSGFYRHARRVIARLPDTVRWREKLLIGRNVLKNIGIHELARHRARDHQLVFLDEGPLHTAHYLFVNVASQPDYSEIAEFMRLVPLPDVVVDVVQSEAVLIQRILKRGHRRISDRSPATAERFVKRAVATFDRMTKDPALRSRLIVRGSHGEVTANPDCPQTQQFNTILELVLVASRGVSGKPERSATTEGRLPCRQCGHQVPD